MGWREDDELDEQRYDDARDAADVDDGDRCGPDCNPTMCCPDAYTAARTFCGCGGGWDHSDCPWPDDDDEEGDDDDEEDER